MATRLEMLKALLACEKAAYQRMLDRVLGWDKRRQPISACAYFAFYLIELP